MFRSRFFWRLFLGHAIVIVLTIVTIGALVVRKHDDDLLQRTRDGLRGQAAALSMLVRPEATVQEFDREAFVREVADDTDSRVTVIRRDGVVVADSVADAATMETHATRPEVVAALEDGYGQDVRLSETTGIETLYVAHVPTPASDVVRVAVGIRSIDEDAAVMTRLLAAAGAVASLLALVISAYIVRRIAVPLEGMRSEAVERARHVAQLVAATARAAQLDAGRIVALAELRRHGAHPLQRHRDAPHDVRRDDE
ncbi:MAG: hypothetical protein AAFR54_23020, partial [Planctomycetota bacterium]